MQQHIPMSLLKRRRGYALGLHALAPELLLVAKGHGPFSDSTILLSP